MKAEDTGRTDRGRQLKAVTWSGKNELWSEKSQ